MRRPILRPAALVLVVPVFAHAQMASRTVEPVSAVRAAAASITMSDVQRRVAVIAHDSMLGRDTPSRGLDQTAAYIAAEFKRLGLKPGGDAGGYIQRFPLRRSEFDTATSTLAASSGERLRIGADYLPLFVAGVEADVAGPVVVIGAELPPEQLPGLGLAGAAVILVPPTTRPGRPPMNLNRQLSALVNEGPSLLVVPSAASDLQWRSRAVVVLQPSVAPAWGEADGPADLAIVSVREAALRTLLSRHGVSYAAFQGAAPRAQRVEGLTLAISLRRRPEGDLAAPNTVGILEGSDPALRHEYVVFSAHMDHVGVGTPDARGDSIYNGADDDGSGTVGVVELAEAFTRLTPAPRRSMIFLTVSGEEKGLWGSDYFSLHPPVPLSQIVADLNMDMIGRNWKDTIVVIGKEHSDLGGTLNRVNAAHPDLGMTAIDDLWPAENFYRRSDHFNFARKGVPILFFFNGTHADYHRPSDAPEKIDSEKEARILKLIFYLGLEVANAAARPAWNPESYRSIVETR